MAVLFAWWLLASAPSEIAVFAIGEGPPRFDQERMAIALMTYLPAPDLMITPLDPADQGAICDVVLQMAQNRQARIVVWYGWTEEGGRRRLSGHLLRTDSSCEKAASFTEPIPAGAPAHFYRVVALKLAGLLKAATGSPPEPVDQAEHGVDVAVEIPANQPLETATHDYETGLILELLAASSLGFGYPRVSGDFGGGALVLLGPWSFGLEFSHAVPADRETSVAEGEQAWWRLVGCGRRLILESRGTELAASIEAGAGLRVVRATGRHLAHPGSAEETAVIPLLFGGVFGVWWIQEWLAITAGPGIDVLLNDVRFRLRDKNLYRSGWVVVRGAVTLRVRMPL